MPTITAYKARFTRLEKVPKESIEPPQEDTEEIPVNLTPFFSRPLPDGDALGDAYWYVTRSYGIEEIGDGWAHVAIGVSSSYAMQNINVRNQGFVKAESGYTLMLEIANLEYEGFPTFNIDTQGQTRQLLNLPPSGWSAERDGEGAFWFPMVVSDVTAEFLLGTKLVVPNGSSIECDIRLSLYEGEYDDIYVPYTESRLEE